MGDEHLINLIRRYNAIYNTKCSEYRDVSFRNAAWEEVAQRYGKPVEECKENWNKLRNCYNNAMKRRQKKNAHAEKIPPWRLEEQMSFLKPYLQSRYPTENFDATVSIATSPPPSPEVVLYSESPTYPESIASPVAYYSSPKANKRKSSSCSEYPDQMIDMMNTSHERQKIQEMDELDTFFLSMSKMVKKLPKVDQIHIKLDLHKAVSEAEIKQLQLEQNKKQLIGDDKFVNELF